MPGISLFNFLIASFGVFLMYFVFPETEKYSLEEIEAHFSDDTKKITDRKIAKHFTQRIETGLL